MGVIAGVLLAAMQIADGVFGNPHLISSIGVLVAFVFRTFILHIMLLGIVLVLVNIVLCILVPRIMRTADYTRLLQYYIGVTVFIVLVPVYVWHDNTQIAEVLRERGGLFPKIVFITEVVFSFGILSYAVGFGVRRLLTGRLSGRLPNLLAHIVWFILLYPLFYEIVLAMLPSYPSKAIQLGIMIALGLLIYFPAMLLGGFTIALVRFRKPAWIALYVILVIGILSIGVIYLLQPESKTVARRDDEINICLITMDAQRADHLGCYGYTPPNPLIDGSGMTPNIDAVAREGLLFENAFSTSSWTLPSVASWLTGKWPHETGVDISNKNFPELTITLPEVLKLSGYRCAAFTCNPWLGPETGIGRGFDEYREYYSTSKASTGLYLDDVWYWINTKLDISGMRELGRLIVNKQLGQAERWLDNNSKGKFFLWVHLYDPHHPWMPPEPYRGQLPDVGGVHRPANFRASSAYRQGSEQIDFDKRRHIINLYDAETRFSDEAVGRLLEKINELGLEEDTLIIIASDHGEELFEHNGLEHGHTLYREVLHVPLIMRLPGKIQSGMRISEPVSLIDLHPTILDFAGAEAIRENHGGESLRNSVINGETQADEDIAVPGSRTPSGRTIYAENLAFFDKDLKVLRIGDWELIHSPNRFHDPVIWRRGSENEGEYNKADSVIFTEGDELYNLAADPFEKKNVIYEYPDIARFMLAKIVEMTEAGSTEGGTGEEALRVYGYYGSGLRDLTRGYGYW